MKAIIFDMDGVLINSENPVDILKATTFNPDEPNSLKPKNPEFMIDKEYVLSSIGLLTMVDRNMAVRMLKKYIVKCGGNTDGSKK